jgi:ATP-dependent RNA helicase SUPV3L1/SUV3
VEQFALKKPAERLSNIFLYYNLYAKLSDLYFLCDTSNICLIADVIHDYALSLKERFTFCLAPIEISDAENEFLIKQVVHLFAKGKDIPISVIDTLRILDYDARSSAEIKELELLNNQLEFYIWCNGQFGEMFIDLQQCQEFRLRCHELIANAIIRFSLNDPEHSHLSNILDVKKFMVH